MPQYVVSVLCDHRTKPNCSADGIDMSIPRVVSRIGHHPKPADAPGSVKRVGWRTWREMENPMPGYPVAYQTIFGVAQRMGRSSLRYGLHDLVPGMTEPQRWDFRCIDCGDTAQCRGSVADRLFAGFLELGWTEVFLADLKDHAERIRDTRSRQS